MHALHESTTYRQCSLAAVGRKVTPDNRTHMGGLVGKGKEAGLWGSEQGGVWDLLFGRRYSACAQRECYLAEAAESFLSEPEGWPVEMPEY